MAWTHLTMIDIYNIQSIIQSITVSGPYRHLFMTTIRQSYDNHTTIIRRSYDDHTTSIRQSYDNHKTIIKQPYDNHTTTIRQSSVQVESVSLHVRLSVQVSMYGGRDKHYCRQLHAHNTTQHNTIQQRHSHYSAKLIHIYIQYIICKKELWFIYIICKKELSVKQPTLTTRKTSCLDQSFREDFCTHMGLKSYHILNPDT